MARKTEAVTHPLVPVQAWWLLATGLAAFLPLLAYAPIWLIGVAGLAFAWRAWLAWQHRPLPTRWLLIPVSLAGAAGVLIEYRTLFGQKAGMALLLILLALKQLEAHAARDGLAIVLLAYFLTLGQFLENQSPPVALTMLATTLVATAALASLVDARARPAALLRLSGTLLAQALPFMLILFVLFPRISGPLWGLPTDAHSSLTGLSDNMSPGAINNLIQSDAIAFRVKFDGPAPRRHELYWRGPVLARLEGRTWRPGIKLVGMRLFHQPTEAGNEYRYSVTLEAHNKPWLFALELPATLGSDMVATSDFQLFARRPVRERMRYDMRSRTGVGYFPERLDVIAEALSLPDTQNPRSVELGARWAADGGSDRERLRRAIDFMRDQGLTYSLQPPLMGEHVADEFLFDARRGFCEHFSSAFVVLMRAAGVPARVVTGYLGGEHNPVDDTWVIRQSDAHAWAEVWIEESGWVRVDPTAASAPARIDQNLAAAIPEGEPLPFLARAGLEWLREIRYRWWAANNLWNQWVLGYNPQRQREFLEKLGMAAPDWRKMGIALGVLGGGTLLALAIWLLWRRRPLDPAEKQWRRATRRLARRDLPRHPWEGPRDYARRVAAARPDLSRQIDAIAQLYARLRYGAAPAQLIDELRRRVAAFKP